MSHLDPRLLDGEDVWRAAWNDLARADRRRVKGAVARGLALDDAREAALAIGYVRSIFTKRASRGLAAAIDPRWSELGDAQLRNAEENNLAVVRAHLDGAPS